MSWVLKCHVFVLVRSQGRRRFLPRANHEITCSRKRLNGCLDVLQAGEEIASNATRTAACGFPCLSGYRDYRDLLKEMF